MHYLSFIQFLLGSLFVGSCAGISFEQDVTLTKEQSNALEKFKKIMSHKVTQTYMKEDIYLLKWLRHNHFDIPTAQQRLLKHVAWYKRNKMNSIEEEDWSDIKQDFKYYLDMRDKYGRSVLYLDVGGLDLRKSLIQGKYERLSRYADKAMQEACALVRDLGHQFKNITRGHLIINLKGYNIMQHGCLRCFPFLLRIVTSYSEHYPECADKIITVNTPGAVEPLLNAIKRLLDQELRDSLHIYGTNRAEWAKALLKDFYVEDLHPSLGGTKFLGIDDE